MVTVRFAALAAATLLVFTTSQNSEAAEYGAPAPEQNPPAYPDAYAAPPLYPQPRPSPGTYAGTYTGTWTGTYTSAPAYPDYTSQIPYSGYSAYPARPDDRAYDEYGGYVPYDANPPYPYYGEGEWYRAGVYSQGRPAPRVPPAPYAAPRALPSAPPSPYYERPPRPRAPLYVDRALERRERELRQRLDRGRVGIGRDRGNLQFQMRSDILFAFDSAALRPDARALIRVIADDLRQNPDPIVLVYGYTDTSGPQIYNLRLSQARAQSVAAELARDGVDPRRITARGFGETRLRVPTRDGVYEPRNRRVEILLQPPVS